MAAVACPQTNDVFNPTSAGNNFSAIVYGVGAGGGTIRVDTNQGGTPRGNVGVFVIGVGF